LHIECEWLYIIDIYGNNPDILALDRSRADSGTTRTGFKTGENYSKAMTSISTRTSLGRAATATVERAGGAVLKYLP
jgi:hypothetical protein